MKKLSSETWRNGDRGQAYLDWAEQWDTASCIEKVNEITVHDPDYPDLDDFHAAGTEVPDA